MDDLLPFYREKQGLEEATFSRIDHDDAMVAIVYKVTLPGSEPLILKICTRAKDYRCELYFLNYFAGTLPVPHMVRSLPPEGDIPGAILMECLPGSPLKRAELSNQLAYEMGTLLARIHLDSAAGYGDLTRPHDLSPDPRVYFTLKFEEEFAECSHHLPPALLKRCSRYYDMHLDLLVAADGPCIIHRDFRPGNVMAHQGKLQGIIDWSSARASFAQEDFCSLEHGDWQAHKSSFLAGYKSVRPVPDYSAMMPLLRLSKAFGVIGFTVKQGTWNKSHARLYKLNRQFLDTIV